MEVTAKCVRLRKLGAIAGAEEKLRLTVTDELNEQPRYVPRKVNRKLPVVGFEVNRESRRAVRSRR